MDLNVIVKEADVPMDSYDVIKNKVNTCHEMEFHTIALSVSVDLASENQTIPEPPSLDEIPPNLTILTRLTVKCTDSMQLYQISKSKDILRYDLLAVEPQNQKMLQYVVTGSADFDILTFDMSEKLDFNFFKCSYTILEKRGVCFEINYAQCQLGSPIRRNIITNAQNLAEMTSKNLILSSGVTDVFRFRAPKDAILIGYLFMLTHNKCYNAVHKNAEKAIALSKRRKNPVSSAIECVSNE